jgi:hypothetical protein
LMGQLPAPFVPHVLLETAVEQAFVHVLQGGKGGGRAGGRAGGAQGGREGGERKGGTREEGSGTSVKGRRRGLKSGSGGKQGFWRYPSSPISPLEPNTSRHKHRDKKVHPERRREREKDPVCTGRTECAGLDFPSPKAYQHHRQLLSLPVDGKFPSLPLHPLGIAVSATTHK